MVDILNRIIIQKRYYLLSYLLINLGFIISFISKFQSIYLKDIVIIFNLVLIGLMIVDGIIYLPDLIKEISGGSKVEKSLKPPITNNFYMNLLRIIGFSLIIVFPIFSGLTIDYNPTLISIISNLCYTFGLILFCSGIIKYGYISPDYDKRSFVNSIYIVLCLIVVFSIFYPNLLSKCLIIFGENFMNIVVISLTFILMTATLSLLAFTYSMLLKYDNFYKRIGKKYFMATIYIIIVTIILFIFFAFLKWFNITNWNSLLNYDSILFIKLNIILPFYFLFVLFVYKIFRLFCYCNSTLLNWVEIW